MTRNYQQALDYAFLLLKYRPRSVQEMRDRLNRKKFSSQDTEAVISYLIDSRYLDDQQFALLFARDKLKRGFGDKRVIYELNRLGIGFDAAAEALAEAGREVDGREILKNLAERAMARKQDREKVIRYLLQRGFALREILKVLNNEN